MTTATPQAEPAKRVSQAENPIPEGLTRLQASAPVSEDGPGIARHGGAYRAGVIRGVSLMTRGECLGHEMWADAETLAQVAALAANPCAGVKSRFTHPGMSSDGLGRHLGRIRDVDVDGDQVMGDLHIQSSARKTPDGDLGAYVMDLAAEDPRAAGLSIVFMHDRQAETEFAIANGAIADDDRLDRLDMSSFQSPDPENVHNYPHVRLAELRAADVVDEPAANPDGLFDRQDGPRDADDFLAYVLKLDDQAEPNGNLFGVDPERAQQFVGRWLDSHGLKLAPVEKEDPVMTDQNPAPPAGPTREEFQAELQRFTEAFGTENGPKWFSEGIEFSEGQTRHNAALQARIDELEAELSESKAKVDSLKGSLGEEEPVDVTGHPQDGKKKSFQSLMNIPPRAGDRQPAA